MKHKTSSQPIILTVIGTLLVTAIASAAVAGQRSAKTPAIVVTPAADVKYRPLDPNDSEGKGPQIAIVFGDFATKAPVGFLFKVPGGFRPGPHIHTADYYSVVLEGEVHDFAAGDPDEGKTIGPGGHWFQAGKVAHDNHCASATPCVIFIYSPTGYDYIPVKKAGGR
jgi:hypothetical protein